MGVGATTSYPRENLTNLGAYMAMARGKSTDNLMTNLFKAYLVASDGNFIRYIRIKKDAYNDGLDITVDALMSHAKTKYEILKQQETWNAMPLEQEQINLFIILFSHCCLSSEHHTHPMPKNYTTDEL
eukprot:2047119-Ditylum_brightwellii.AAC.1